MSVRILCSTCGKYPPRPDRRTCEACAAYQRTQREAHAARRRAWYAIPENRAKDRAAKRDLHHRDPSTVLLGNAKTRAKRDGVLFSMTIDDVIVPEICPVLGIPITVGDGVTGDGSPSIDRIIPSRGYVHGNVWVISHKANTIKSDATPVELMLVAVAVRKKTFLAKSHAWMTRASCA